MDNNNLKEDLSQVKGTDIINLEDIIAYILKNVEYQKISQKKNTTKNNQEIKEKIIKQDPQIGDIVTITKGSFKGIQGKIIAIVEGYQCYQIQIDNLNAIYVNKDKIEVISSNNDNKVKDVKNRISSKLYETKGLINKLKKSSEIIEKEKQNFTKFNDLIIKNNKEIEELEKGLKNLQ